MNKKSISLIAENILFFEFLEKKAKKSAIDLRKHKDKINEMFNDYIKDKKFLYKDDRVKYADLPVRLKEKVWEDFWDDIHTKRKDVEDLVDKTIMQLS